METAQEMAPAAAENTALAEARAQLERARAEAKEQAELWAQLDQARVQAEEQSAFAAAEVSEFRKRLVLAREDLRVCKAAADAGKRLWLASLWQVAPCISRALTRPLY